MIVVTDNETFLYALRREVLRNIMSLMVLVGLASLYTPFGVRCFGTGWDSPSSRSGTAWSWSCFYTPFGVRCFGTYTIGFDSYIGEEFLYALRREVLRNVTITEDEAADTDRCFYTPFGVRCFGTLSCCSWRSWC